MQVNDAFDATVCGNDDQRGYFFLFHQGERGGGKGATVDGNGVGIHDVGGGVFEGVAAIAFKQAAEVAVGDHAGECVVRREDSGHT